MQSIKHSIYFSKSLPFLISRSHFLPLNASVRCYAQPAPHSEPEADVTTPPRARQTSEEVRSNLQSTTGLAKEVRLIQIRMVRNMTKNGKIMSYSAAVVAGNLDGGIGYGVGKDKKPNDAVLKATRLAERDMEFFERYDGRTLFHDISVKFKATKIHVRAAPAETGRRCHWAIQEICRCMGIQDISAKVYGSRHPMNVVQAFLLALRRQKTPEQVAFDSGMKLIDVLKVYEYGLKNNLKA